MIGWDYSVDSTPQSLCMDSSSGLRSNEEFNKNCYSLCLINGSRRKLLFNFRNATELHYRDLSERKKISLFAADFCVFHLIFLISQTFFLGLRATLSTCIHH